MDDYDEMEDPGDDIKVNRVSRKSVSRNPRKGDKKICVESSSGHNVKGSHVTKKRTREKAGLEGVSCEARGQEEEVADGLPALTASRGRGRPTSKKSKVLRRNK